MKYVVNSEGLSQLAMVEKTVLQVNAQSFEIEVQPDTPLLYVLRNQLNLKAPKYGCGMGQCGSCMVLVAGQTMYSCQLTVAQVQQHQITTLEGLGATDKIGSSVVDAFLKEQAAQCGFCTNGMIMSAVSLLRQ
ncbi:MAG: 2Fe-2S iron-sulfur cluster-binding protein, partial [Saprospiraceae bacterium]|nr:2Fe-2S iron-sulfur cluster-binding protein [Saprospiraceae bacterium]